jgi:peptidyl-prolyl cis-trans isomerase A (cyclophilin A)
MIVQLRIRPLLMSLVGILVLQLATAACATVVRFQTTVGNIDVRLYDSAAPLHVANLLNYINSNRYDGTFIHRSAKLQNGQNFVIQGGGYKILSSLLAQPIESGWTRIQNFGMVTNEPKISNLRGTLALAKGTGISSGTSEWFINLNNANTFLDQPPPASNAFTVFGRVLGTGMTIADNIANLARVNASVSDDYNTAFTEVPVLDVNKVLSQGDVLNEDVVRLTDMFVLNFKAGDYDFNGAVNSTDYTVWRNSFGSTTNAAADGDGNGIVDAADYVVWRNTLGQSGGPGSAAGEVVGASVPEPASGLLFFAAGLYAVANRRFLAESRRRKAG